MIIIITSVFFNYSLYNEQNMTKIRSLDELKKIHAEQKLKMEARSDKSNPDQIIQVKVTMATCGIASGSRPVLDFMKEELEKRNIPALISQTGCMCYCYAEPTVEVTMPGKEPVMFGYVNLKKADEIIERYIRKGELIEGIIPMNFERIDTN
jgi:NADP-reducing hydrogenase subunit HndB